ncbi:MAG: four helix bundle protein [Methanotrichaceae archaeon]
MQEVISEALDFYRTIFAEGEWLGWVHLDQLARASASIPANVAEGSAFGRRLSRRRTVHFFYALGSLEESKVFLRIAAIEGRITRTRLGTLLKLADELEQEIHSASPGKITDEETDISHKLGSQLGDRIVRALGNGPLRALEIADIIDANPTSIYTILSRLKERDLVRKRLDKAWELNTYPRQNARAGGGLDDS